MSLLEKLMGLGLEGNKADAITNQTVGANTAVSLELGKTATGTNLATAYALTKIYTLFTTAASGTGASLSPLMDIGSSMIVKNRGANDMLIYPPTSSGIVNGGSAGAGATLTAGTGATFRKTGTLTYES